jgi:DNA-binding LacI/PurR family transcriptional regulator
MAVTLKQVALEAGVDMATVSRALNGSYGVKTETRQRVLAVAKKLKYVPNRIATGLATGRSHIMAIVVSDIRNPFFAEVTRGAEDEAYEAGYDLVLCNSDLNPVKQIHYFRSLLEKRVEGIIMNSVATLSRTFQEELSRCGVPIVLLNQLPGVLGFSTVIPDNFEGGMLAGTYLSRLGHRVIGQITGPPKHGNFRERTRGFLKACDAASKKVKTIVIHGHQSSQGGYEMMKKLLAKHRDVTAIFAGNDAIAFGAIRAAAESGLSVPGDMSIIGFDDVEFAGVVRPPLSTIHCPKYEMGKAAVEILLRHAMRPKSWSPEHRIFGVRLIERESCRAV